MAISATLRTANPARWTWLIAFSIGALGLLGCGRGDDAGADTLAGLTARLRGQAGESRRSAAAALGRVVGPGALAGAEALIEAAGDRSDPTLRAIAVRSLGVLVASNSWTTRPALDAIIAALTSARSDGDPGVRVSAVLALYSLGRPPADLVSALIDGSRGDEPAVRADCLAALAGLTIQTSADLRRFIELLDGPDPGMCELAASVLERPGPRLSAEAALPALASVLRSGSPGARRVATTALGRVADRSPAVRDTLASVLARDVDPMVRAAAAAALGAFSEDPLGRLTLRMATDDADLRVRATAWASLAAGRRSARSEALAELRAAIDAEPRRSAAWAGVESDPVRLTDALADASLTPRLRAAAARALGETLPAPADVPRAIERLARSLTDRDPLVRRAAASALSRFGGSASSASSALERAVSDGDRGVSAAALVALRGLDPARRTTK